MAKRTASEIISQARIYFPENPPDGYEDFLGDIADSVGDVDLGNYVEKTEYEKILGERDAAVADKNRIRDQYINRFYDTYNGTTDIGFINGQTRQEDLQEEEKHTNYEDLWE